MEHMNVEDVERYLDTQNTSEEYLLWAEQKMDHVAQCEKCQKLIQKVEMLWEVDQLIESGEAVKLLDMESSFRNELRNLKSNSF